jgi:hypothetical protein
MHLALIEYHSFRYVIDVFSSYLFNSAAVFVFLWCALDCTYQVCKGTLDKNTVNAKTHLITSYAHNDHYVD